MKKLNVLIVDDLPVMRDMLQVYLKLEENIRVVGMAENGMAAVEIVRKKAVDIIFMDINMPYMDGISATRVITESCPDIKIVILTMHDEISMLSEALKAGAAGYLIKPVKKSALLESIDSLQQGKYYPGFRTDITKGLSLGL